MVWLFTKAVYNEKSKFILTEKEERDLVDKALDFNFNAYTYNDVIYGNRIIIDKSEMIDFLHFVDTYYKTEIKIFEIFYYAGVSKYSISFYWESKFIEQKPNNENILIRYIQSDDLKPETFFKLDKSYLEIYSAYESLKDLEEYVLNKFQENKEVVKYTKKKRI